MALFRVIASAATDLEGAFEGCERRVDLDFLRFFIESLLEVVVIVVVGSETEVGVMDLRAGLAAFEGSKEGSEATWEVSQVL